MVKSKIVKQYLTIFQKTGDSLKLAGLTVTACCKEGKVRKYKGIHKEADEDVHLQN